MQIGSLIITAPALGLPAHNDAETFGAATWLWMQEPDHRDLPLLALSQLLLPPIQCQQYILASEAVGETTRPVAYLAWANLSAEAESRYLHNPARGLRQQDWHSGDRMWLTDWFTPFGHAKAFRAALRELLPVVCARALYHRGNERGMRVMTFHGKAVSPAQERQWWRERPMLAYTAQPTSNPTCV